MKPQDKEDRQSHPGFVALLFGVLSAFAVSPVAAETIAIGTATQQLRVDAVDGTILDWRTSPHAALVSEFSDGTRSRHLRIFAGTDDTPPQELDFHAVHGVADMRVDMQAHVGSLRVSRSLRLPVDGAGLHLAVTFFNESDSQLNVRGPVAGPAIAIGPGLGAENVAYEGIAASMYDFLSAVFLPVGGDEAAVLEFGDPTGAISSPENVPVVWAGLNTRYQLLAVAAPERLPFTSVRFEPVAALAAELERTGRNPQHAAELSLDLPVVSLQAGESRELVFDVYGGVKDASALQAGDVDFTPVLFNGLWSWMRALCFALLWVMGAINGLIGNLGVTIILLAIAIRLVLYPLGKAAARQQLRFNEKQAELKPELERIKATYRGGEQAEHIFELYRRHGVSPAAGVKSLLIVLIQIPVFIALFHILGQAVQFRGAPFLWIDDLARPDAFLVLPFTLPYFGSAVNLLPILMAVVSLAAMGMNRAGDESRAQFAFLIAVNIGFFLLFYHFPAGMVLYWTMANLLHMLQHVLVKVSKPRAKED